MLRTQVCVNTAVPTAPLAIGDAMLGLAGLSSRHDLYAAILGIMTLWGAGLLFRQVYRLPKVIPCLVLGTACLVLGTACVWLTRLGALEFTWHLLDE